MLERVPRPAVTVRELGIGNLEKIAAIHCAAFPKSLLTKLGRAAVERYYAWQFEGALEVFPLGAYFEEELAGFCFAGIFPRAISGFLDRNRPLLLRRLAARPWLLADPMFTARFKRALGAFKRRRTDELKHAAFAQPSNAKRPLDILSIAVDPHRQGLGIGKALMAHAEALGRSHGYHVMTLIVNADNAQAIAFYESLGWERAPVGGPWKGSMEKWFYGRWKTHP